MDGVARTLGALQESLDLFPIAAARPLAVAWLVGVWVCLLVLFVRLMRGESLTGQGFDPPPWWGASPPLWRAWERAVVPAIIVVALGATPVVLAEMLELKGPLDVVAGYGGLAFFFVGLVLGLTCAFDNKPQFLIPEYLRRPHYRDDVRAYRESLDQP